MVKSYKKTLTKRSINFDKKTLSIIHLLHPYVKQRLKVGESFGILPKNMFQSNGIIDEVVLEIYESKTHYKKEFGALRLLMFDEANKKLERLFENEKWHKKSISTKLILEEELKLLEENFTIDGGMDLIMNEELDDISYHQNDDEHYFLTNGESNENIMTFLGIQKNSINELKSKRNILQDMYNNLPLQTSNVVDLYVLGKLNLQEIAGILDADILELKRIIQFVKENFKKRII